MHRKLLVLMLSLVIGLGLVPLAPGAQAATEDWVLEGQMPFGLSEFVSAELPDGRLFVALGYDPSTGEYSDQAHLFDPYEMTWAELANAPVARIGATCAYLDGMVFVFGGRSSAYQFELNVHIYDVARDLWSVGPAMPEDGMNIQCSVIGENQILVVGLGSDYYKCYSFDTDTRDFTVRDGVPGGGRRGAAMVRDGESLLLFGGYDRWDGIYRDVLRYDIPGNDWSPVGVMPVFLAGHSAVLGGDGLVYIMGGSYFAGQQGMNDEDSSLAYDTLSGEFIALPVLVEPFRFGAVCELEDGRVLLWGGNDRDQSVTGVYSLRAWEMETSLSADSVEQGGSVWLNVTLRTNFAPAGPMQGKAVITFGEASYAVYDLYSASGSMRLLMSISEDFPTGAYVVEIVGLGLNEGQDFQVTPMPLTVTEASSADERLDELQDQLNETQGELADLKDSLDGKMEAWVGYVLLGMLVIVLVVLVLQMVRKR